jgi:hypothetical protein
MYTFWDYFFGWLILAMFVIPALSGLLINIVISALGAWGMTNGMPEQTGATTVSINEKFYDHDEDY